MKKIATIIERSSTELQKRFFVPCIAAFLMSVAAVSPTVAADMSFSGSVVRANSAAMMPQRAVLNVFGSTAALDVQVSTAGTGKPRFSANYLNGDDHAVRVVSMRQHNGVYLARLQLPTNGINRERVLVCAKSAASKVCGRLIINTLK